MMRWELQTDLPVQLALIIMEDLRITGAQDAYAELIRCADTYRENYGDQPISEVPGVAAARRFFRAIGIEPTRRRPSSEALLKRALGDKGFHPVNTLVDVCNWCSLDFLLPICVYDSDKIVGDVAVRIGREGEGYDALNHRRINLGERYLLADRSGPFGSPMTDSLRTAIGEETRNVALIIFAPDDHDRARLASHAATFADRVARFCGGRVTGQDILVPG